MTEIGKRGYHTTAVEPSAERHRVAASITVLAPPSLADGGRLRFHLRSFSESKVAERNRFIG
ncbi:MAG: hypothetical protein KJS91_04460 [Planctomycetes bacterium]|nr:hypothetical protein [Planctomycetota bacterium]